MLPDLMYALQRDEHGLSLQQRPVPTPAADEVLLKVAYAGICRTDLQAAQGKLLAKTPMILGHEFSGRVVAVGENVSTALQDVRVAVFPLLSCGRCELCRQNHTENCMQSEMLGLQRDGCFAEYIAVPAAATSVIPDNISWQEAAYAEPVAAALSIKDYIVSKDIKCLIYGRNRIAELLLQIVTALGVEDVRLYDPTRDASPPLQSMDLIIETVATTESISEMMHLLRPRGMLLLKSRLAEDVRLNLPLAVRKELCLQAVNYAPFAEALQWLVERRLRVEEFLGVSYRLQEYEAAFAAACTGEAKKIFFAISE